MAQDRSSLETFDRLMRGEPQAGGEAGAGRPVLPRSEQQKKADATTQAARELIDAERKARDDKTERLRASRLAREAREEADK